MSNLELAKQIIKENIADGKHGIFDTRNLIGDRMTCLYRGNELQVDICYGWKYFEVFGLTEVEFAELEEYYEELIKEDK